MSINAVEKYNLESLAYDLKNSGKSYAEIAETLSETAGAKISKSMVFAILNLTRTFGRRSFRISSTRTKP